MDSRFLEYSRDAVNVLSKFHETDFIIYVEDEDDKYFWDTIFKVNKVKFTYYFEPVGGCAELDNKIEKIIKFELGNTILVARDADYIVLSSKAKYNDRVIYTYGYSIENCIFNKDAIAELIKSNCRNNESCKENIEFFYNYLFENLLYLWEFDYFCVTEGCSKKVLGDNCSKFLMKQNNFKFNIDFIKNEILNLENEIKIKEHIEPSLDDFIRWLRGHFLQSALLVFIKKLGDIKSLPSDNLFSQACGLLKYTLLDDEIRKNYYMNICNRINQLLN